ncbi:MAG: TetR/AcrR family transcriptional regulator [Actinomycetota bacterium]|nr:TetR/AcrR family transcriptional regulator [Actinomycetota bacterium]
MTGPEAITGPEAEAASTPRSVRARVRAELTAEIVAAAGEELAEVGPAALSLRSVARRLGMVPSALYRYFPSRDSLLTALITEAYEAVGAVAEQAAGSADGSLDRWLALCRAVRTWGRAHPQQWALIYGSPVPGYAAPQTTVAAALRVTLAVAGVLRDAPGARPPQGVAPDEPGLEPVVAPIRDALLPGRDAPTVAATVLAWTSLTGMVSLELFGHYEGGTTEFEPLFAYCMALSGRAAGLD